MLDSLGYPQLPKIMLRDNSFAVDLANGTITAKRSKTIENKFHWINYQVFSADIDAPRS